MVGMHRNRVSARTKVAAKWLSKIKKAQVQPKGRKGNYTIIHEINTDLQFCCCVRLTKPHITHLILE